LARSRAQWKKGVDGNDYGIGYGSESREGNERLR